MTKQEILAGLREMPLCTCCESNKQVGIFIGGKSVWHECNHSLCEREGRKYFDSPFTKKLKSLLNDKGEI